MTRQEIGLMLDGERAYKLAVQKLLKALGGIASCATDCVCCQMHQRIASKAIEDFNSLKKGR